MEKQDVEESAVIARNPLGRRRDPEQQALSFLTLDGFVVSRFQRETPRNDGPSSTLPIFVFPASWGVTITVFWLLLPPSPLRKEEGIWPVLLHRFAKSPCAMHIQKKCRRSKVRSTFICCLVTAKLVTGMKLLLAALLPTLLSPQKKGRWNPVCLIASELRRILGYQRHSSTMGLGVTLFVSLCLDVLRRCLD